MSTSMRKFLSVYERCEGGQSAGFKHPNPESVWMGFLDSDWNIDTQDYFSVLRLVIKRTE